VGILGGYEVRFEARGVAMTVPKGAKAAGVSGSGWRRSGADGLMDGRAILDGSCYYRPIEDGCLNGWFSFDAQGSVVTSRRIYSQWLMASFTRDTVCCVQRLDLSSSYKQLVGCPQHSCSHVASS